jgi:hypothetical protein
MRTKMIKTQMTKPKWQKKWQPKWLKPKWQPKINKKYKWEPRLLKTRWQPKIIKPDDNPSVNWDDNRKS